MLGPYNVAVSEGAKGDGTNPDKRDVVRAGGGFSITVKSPERIPTTSKEGHASRASGDVGRRRQGGPRRRPTGGGGAEAVITQETARLERELEKAFIRSPRRASRLHQGDLAVADRRRRPQASFRPRPCPQDRLFIETRPKRNCQPEDTIATTSNGTPRATIELKHKRSRVLRIVVHKHQVARGIARCSRSAMACEDATCRQSSPASVDPHRSSI